MKTETSLVRLLFEAKKSSAEMAASGIGLWSGTMKSADFFEGPYFALLDWATAASAIEALSTKDFSKLFNVTSAKMSDDIANFLLSANVCKGIICHKDLGDYEQISYVAAEKGYGPALYYIVAEDSDSGFIGSDKDVTDAAAKIWKHFYDQAKTPRKARQESFEREELQYIYAPSDPSQSFESLRAVTKSGNSRLASSIIEKAVAADFDEMDMKILEHWLTRGIENSISRCCLLFFERKYWR